jgi:Na+/H+ antiporter NhaD/arsenite permease-like protein
MLSATLGGNATLIGASANVLAAGIGAGHVRQISALRTADRRPQLTVLALYVLALFFLMN